MNAKPAARSGSGLKGCLVVLGVVALAVIALLLAVPQIVKQKCIDTAAAEGVTLTIGGAQVAWGAVHLSDVKFAIPEVPQITGEATDVNVTLAGLAPETITGVNVGVTIQGPADQVMAAIDAWQAKHVKEPGSKAAETAAQQKIVVQSGHLTWTGAFGQVGKLDASNVTAEADGAGTSFHLTAEKTTIGTPKGDLGPWRMSFERDGVSVRTRFELDPAMRDGPSVLYVTTKAGGISLKVAVPRSPLARIGVPPAVFGLSSGQTTQVEAQIDLEKPTATQANMNAQVSLLGARLGAAPVAADVKLDLAAAGNPAKPLDISRGSLVVGPFKANVVGTLTLFQDGARLALSWNAQAVKCEEIAKNAAKDALGEFGQQLSAFATQLGVAKVTGDAHASGLLTVDTRNLNDVSFTITAKDTCGIAVLP